MNIHYISPYCLDKNYGKSINEAIERLNAGVEDWVCIRDGDTAFLTPDYGVLIHEAIERYKNEYSLIGCYTNRLGSEHQTIASRDDWFFNEMDMSKHYDKALSMKESWESEVKVFTYDLAAMFMLFPVKIWQKVKFKENTLIFDREFTKGVRMAGGKVGILPGLYVLHLYRIWAKDRESAKHNIKHLIK